MTSSSETQTSSITISTTDSTVTISTTATTTPMTQTTLPVSGNSTMTTVTSQDGGNNGGNGGSSATGGGSGGDAGKGQRTPVRPSAAVQTNGVDLGRGKASVSFFYFLLWCFWITVSGIFEPVFWLWDGLKRRMRGANI